MTAAWAILHQAGQPGHVGVCGQRGTGVGCAIIASGRIIMSHLKLQRTELLAGDGTPVRLVYDEDTDVLEIFFGENGPARGIELTDQIVLRLAREVPRALGLTLLHFSILSEQTIYGPRSWRLDSLDRMPEDLREIVLRVLTALPVSQFLKLTQLQTGYAQFVPVAYVDPQAIVAYA
jgi:hypothetical protein